MTVNYPFDIIKLNLRERGLFLLEHNNSSDMAEATFLAGYSIEKYERPSVTTDIAAFSLRTQKSAEYRLSPVQKLCILLIKRGQPPFKDCWALPGGFLKKNETVEECAFRELKEETNLVPEAMLRINTFSKPGRDPRGWIISNAFASVSCEEDVKIAGNSDAADAKWFDVCLDKCENGEYLLTLGCDGISLSAKLEKIPSKIGGFRFEIKESDGLSFDHAAIIAEALETLKNEAKDIEIVFSFLPEKFTLSMLQHVHETLMGISHLTPNFRRKIAEYVEETDEYTEGVGHRPARLFRKK